MKSVLIMQTCFILFGLFCVVTSHISDEEDTETSQDDEDDRETSDVSDKEDTETSQDDKDEREMSQYENDDYSDENKKKYHRYDKDEEKDQEEENDYDSEDQNEDDTNEASGKLQKLSGVRPPHPDSKPEPRQLWPALENAQPEKAAGSMADLFGTNQHFQIPLYYEDLGRRLLLEKKLLKTRINEQAEKKLDSTVKEYLKNKKNNESKNTLKIVKASPEFVLSVARQSAMLEAARQVNPTNEVIQKDALRSGNYWNDVWQEDVNPELLRSGREVNTESLRVIIAPGSRLYQLVSALKESSPRLLYVINHDD